MSKQIEAMKLALARLQARTDTADLDAIAALNEALAEKPAQQEPVQYQRREIGEGGWMDCTKEQYEKAMALPEWDTRVITTPQAQPAREPLTHEQINKAAEDEDNETAFLVGFYVGARFAEAAHGITKGNT